MLQFITVAGLFKLATYNNILEKPRIDRNYLQEPLHNGVLY